MPRPCMAGSTATGPNPYQPAAPSPMATGEKAACPTAMPASCATSDSVNAPAARRASMM
ncbi:Uncharacterised protein [Achromobacter xylosoxidans]|nr:Uncharacterised protein [Achromobacter xylosoxidans]CUJ61871.1 Uncharacterised protein [Achromobacter xylosoxidans]